MGLPASSVAVIWSGDRFPATPSVPGRRGVDAGVHRFAVGIGEPAVMLRRRLPGDGLDLGGQQRQDDAVLVVDHGLPSNVRNDAPALSSPPNAIEPSSRPSTNHLNRPALRSFRPMPATTLSMSDEDTSVLPTAASGFQPGR